MPVVSAMCDYREICRDHVMITLGQRLLVVEDALDDGFITRAEALLERAEIRRELRDLKKQSRV